MYAETAESTPPESHTRIFLFIDIIIFYHISSYEERMQLSSSEYVYAYKRRACSKKEMNALKELERIS